ncbi:hypothetical protein GCM10023185_45690 [Hymenobacter saemangeumensis]|uniref:Secretion system C-terminal sorting domain-containing protein n=1 Tax=Hymenobacter saemangeumensis TaxID=1084522 RepID=A0ABP8ISN7_9BACT
MRQQRQKLEGQLAADDKAQLADYRTQLKKLHARGKALHESLRPQEGSDGARPVPTEAQRQQRQQLHSEREAVMSKVRELAKKYESNIRQLADEVAPQQAQWKADMDAIGAKHAAPGPQSNDVRAEGREGRRGHGHGPHGGPGHSFGPVKFLLMNPAPPMKQSPETSSSTLYPNPAVANSQLEYSVKKTGPVTIDLLDAQGSKLRTVLQEVNQEKGSHTQSLNISDLPTGTYYYKIITRSGSETKRFIKE